MTFLKGYRSDAVGVIAGAPEGHHQTVEDA